MTETPLLLGGRYELAEVIGRGGMAEVHAGRDLRLGRTVAIKVLRADLARDPLFQARFRREAQSAAGLNHPSVVSVYDTGEDTLGGHAIPYIVMEYVAGSTLRELLNSGRRLLPERALEITMGVLTALDYSHRHGIIHRDIKPGNVMLTASGEVKVMDFGIARAIADTAATMTQTAAVIGTAQYLSPEQARGEQVDARSDLYSTGCLLYELLTGRPPFVGDSPVSVAYQHVREEPNAPSSLDPDIPAAIDTVALKSLVKDREDRYQTAAEMRSDLERALAGLPVAAVLPTFVDAEPTRRLAQTGARNDATTRTGMLPAAPPPQRRRRGRGIAFWLLLAVITLGVFLAAALVGRSLSSNARPTQVAVPSVVGQSVTAATKTLEDKDFVVKTVTRADQAPAKEVLSQAPEPRALADPRSTVTLTVSSGPGKVTVPKLAGQSLGNAREALRGAGLGVGEITYVNATDAFGQVLASSPDAGASVAPNADVTLRVANGKNDVPKVTGQPLDKARTTLQDAGFRVQTTAAPNGSVAPDTVLNQDPADGTSLKLGSTVTLVVAQAVASASAQPTSPAASPTPTTTPRPTTTPTPTPTASRTASAPPSSPGSSGPGKGRGRGRGGATTPTPG